MVVVIVIERMMIVGMDVELGVVTPLFEDVELEME
jgi:hypothetical protein